jgi:hypothetical protein
MSRGVEIVGRRGQNFFAVEVVRQLGIAVGGIRRLHGHSTRFRAKGLMDLLYLGDRDSIIPLVYWYR